MGQQDILGGLADQSAESLTVSSGSSISFLTIQLWQLDDELQCGFPMVTHKTMQPIVSDIQTLLLSSARQPPIAHPNGVFQKLDSVLTFVKDLMIPEGYGNTFSNT